ncbi:hypothetical protein [Sphaerisporangium corydalis]|uniref:Uncharacterized protein n=1 Tax=Sphaerisporangium corydalis TaxID=1441875 RepID=A0ABV9E941_9ACTN|nr:hypothetical protein [Sphaerisporangium corydalis]
MKRTTIVVACLAAAACTTSPAATGEAPPTATATSPAAVAPSPEATPPALAPSPSATVAGGCGDNPVRSGNAPVWAAPNAPDIHYVLGDQGDTVGFLFAEPLRAGAPTDPANKILWYVRHPRGTFDLRVTAHPRGKDRPVVHTSFAANSGPGEIYPSVTDVPTPGCWTFELTWGPHHDTVDLRYRR